MRVLITGSREVRDRELGRMQQAMVAVAGQAYLRGEPVTVVHGATRGADRVGATAARRLGFTVEGHAADWHGQGKAAGPIRNQKMVDLGADVVLAFPERSSRGTWDCVRRALAAGIPVFNGWTFEQITETPR